MKLYTTGNGTVIGLAVEVEGVENGQFMLKNDHLEPFGERVILMFSNRFEALEFCGSVKKLETLILETLGFEKE